MWKYIIVETLPLPIKKNRMQSSLHSVQTFTDFNAGQITRLSIYLEETQTIPKWTMEQWRKLNYYYSLTQDKKKSQHKVFEKTV